MSATEDLARELRARDNREKIGVRVGKLVGNDPYVVEVGKMRAEGKNLKIAAHLLTGYRTYNIIESETMGRFAAYITLQTDVIQPGDAVIVAVSDNNQTFYVLDKVVTQA